MKNLLLAAVLLCTIAASAQKNTVNIKFNEHVQIQDLGLPQEFGAYIPILEGDGVMKFDVYDDKEPLHLIIHTVDNTTYNLVIIPSDEKVKLPKYEWRRTDKVIDLTTFNTTHKL